MNPTNPTTWTERMIEAITAKAEARWERLHKATNPNAKAFHEREYNRCMFAVKKLQMRLAERRN